MLLVNRNSRESHLMNVIETAVGEKEVRRRFSKDADRRRQDGDRAQGKSVGSYSFCWCHKVRRERG